MLGFEHMKLINRPYRTQEEAQARVGETITYDGEQWICDSFNDLGCLYWRKRGGKKIFVIPGYE